MCRASHFNVCLLRRIGYLRRMSATIQSEAFSTATAIEATGQPKPAPEPLAFAIARTLRPHQWVKNGLVYVPLFLSHRYRDVGLLVPSTLAFVSIGCCASAGYVWNDLRDRKADRLHPRKKDRPFASGRLSTATGGILIAVLLLSSWIPAKRKFLCCLCLCRCRHRRGIRNQPRTRRGQPPTQPVEPSGLEA